MKRSLTLSAILAVSVFLVISAFVSADDEVVSGNQNRLSFIDADGDGVCDNSGKALGSGKGWSKKNRTNFVDEDGDGVCDNFVDEDGDGICDNCVNGECAGAGGAYFVDEDGDGVCDNFDGGQKRCGGSSKGSRGNRSQSGK